MFTCKRCEGTGFLPQYSHIAGGVCFHCEGSGRTTSFKHSIEMLEEIIQANECIEKNISEQGDFEKFRDAHSTLIDPRRIFNLYLKEHGFNVTTKAVAKARVMKRHGL